MVVVVVVVRLWGAMVRLRVLREKVKRSRSELVSLPDAVPAVVCAAGRWAHSPEPEPVVFPGLGLKLKGVATNAQIRETWIIESHCG